MKLVEPIHLIYLLINGTLLTSDCEKMFYKTDGQLKESLTKNPSNHIKIVIILTEPADRQAENLLTPTYERWLSS